MKDYKERTDSIRSKVKNAKRRRHIAISVVSTCCCVALLVGVILLPRGNDSTQKNYSVRNVVQGYDPLIARLSALLEEPEYDVDLGIPEIAPDVMAPGTAVPDDAPALKGDEYQEVTDNQVAGVTEADLIKRSDKYIFYLREDALSAYSIEGESSRELGSYPIASSLGAGYDFRGYETEMYLSSDCRTVTVIGKCYCQEEGKLYLYLESLDVSDPTSIQLRGNLFLNGSYNTSRLICNDLYVISRLYVSYDADFTDESTFLPGYGEPEDMEYLPMNKICLPEEANSAMYTVVTKLRNDDLEVVDSLAMLSADGTVYASQNNIFLTRSKWESSTQDNVVTSQTFTEITRISIAGKELSNEGTVKVAGRVDDQYYLDEHDGILRVVTTLSGSSYTEYSDGMVTSMTPVQSITNASLYCIALKDNSIRAQVERFAPDGESVRSVRFDGDKAYVCTSIVLMDPVFFFDLSDLDNITVKDTGTIDGYSMSLVDFAEGFLMGIGYGDDFDTLKVEMYREGATSVESHCAFERGNCYFSDEYKSYYIDRKNQLIGLGIGDYTNGENVYLLLHFDGYSLRCLLEAGYDGTLGSTRAVYIDGWLYLFGDSFQVIMVE